MGRSSHRLLERQREKKRGRIVRIIYEKSPTCWRIVYRYRLRKIRENEERSREHEMEAYPKERERKGKMLGKVSYKKITGFPGFL